MQLAPLGMVKLLVIDPVRHVVRRASMIQTEVGYELHVDGRRLLVDAEQLSAMQESCVPAPPTLLDTLLHREQRICFGRVDGNRYVPLLGRSTAVYIVLDLDLSRTVLVNPRELPGRDNEVIVSESTRIRVAEAWLSWETVQKLYEYTVTMIGTLPPARLVIGGLRERHDRATGRIYLDFLPGLTKEQLVQILEGVKALELIEHMPPERREQLVRQLALPATLYRSLYEETRKLLYDVIDQARRLGYELIASYAEAKLEQLASMRSIAERLGLATETLIAPVARQRQHESQG